MNQDPLLVDNFLNRICSNQLKPQMCGYACRSNCTFDPCKHRRLIDVENRSRASILVNQEGRRGHVGINGIGTQWKKSFFGGCFSTNSYWSFLFTIYSLCKILPRLSSCKALSSVYLSKPSRQGSKRGPLLALDKRPSFFGSKDWKMVVFT